MIIFWTVVITLLCVVQLIGMIWAWRWLPSNLGWRKRLTFTVFWPAALLFAISGNVQ